MGHIVRDALDIRAMTKQYAHGWNDPRMWMQNQYVFSAATNLAPLACEIGAGYRVPAQLATEKNNTYVVHVGDMQIRVFGNNKKTGINPVGFS